MTTVHMKRADTNRYRRYARHGKVSLVMAVALTVFLGLIILTSWPTMTYVESWAILVDVVLILSGLLFYTRAGYVKRAVWIEAEARAAARLDAMEASDR